MNDEIQLTHSWRSSTTNYQKTSGGSVDQIPYQSTGLKYTHIPDQSTEAFFSVSNILEKENGLVAYSSMSRVHKIYPYDFSRKFQVGLNIKF
jgi:hypothetical protein